MRIILILLISFAFGQDIVFDSLYITLDKINEHIKSMNRTLDETEEMLWEIYGQDLEVGIECEHGTFISSGDGMKICTNCGKGIIYDKKLVNKLFQIEESHIGIGDPPNSLPSLLHIFGNPTAKLHINNTPITIGDILNYAEECYTDSTEYFAFKELYNGVEYITICDSTSTPILGAYYGSICKQYWEHKEPTLKGFIEWLERKIK